MASAKILIMKTLKAILSWFTTWFTFPQRLAKLEIQVSNAREFASREEMARYRETKELKEIVIRESARLFAVTFYFINYKTNLFDSAVFYGREGETKLFQISVQKMIPEGTWVIISGCGDIERFLIGNMIQNPISFGITGSRISSFQNSATPGQQITISIKFGAPRIDEAASVWNSKW